MLYFLDQIFINSDRTHNFHHPSWQLPHVDSIQYQARDGIQVFHVWMSYQNLVSLLFWFRVRKDLQQYLP